MLVTLGISDPGVVSGEFLTVRVSIGLGIVEIPITESRNEGGWLRMRYGKRYDHVFSGGFVGQSALVSQ